MSLDRRDFLSAMLLAGMAPSVVRSEAIRPKLSEGVAVGDLLDDRAVLWTRADRPCRVVVEWDVTDQFAAPHRVVGPFAVENTDFTAKLELEGLPASQRIAYRVMTEDLRDTKNRSEWTHGTFVTPSAKENDFTLVYTGDVCGQGWGIDEARGGYRIFAAMRKLEPDLFVHLGDTIYADNPLAKEVKLEDGTIWKNLVTEEKSKVAETLAEFRGNHRYNFLDQNLRAFNASVAQMVLWDDHEVRNNWFPGERKQDPRYTESSDDLLAARALAAFLEYYPIRVNNLARPKLYRSSRFGPLLEVFAWDMRSDRGPNTNNRQKELTPESSILGRTQLDWLKKSLKASKSLWKVIASDMPLSLIVGDGPQRYEAVANGDHGAPLGRELEIAELLRFISESKIANVVFITADVHYCAAHYYDPARAKFNQFDPFWEFVAGPANAGSFGPGELDSTFGPELKFLGIPKGMKPNRSPAEGLQFFGALRIDAKTKAMRSSLHDVNGKKLYEVELGMKE
jgi:alkaline phosphatase D